MFNKPQALEEAIVYRYRRWSGNENGQSYRKGFCAYEVPDGGRSVLFHQCWRKNGHGPAKLYCKQHSKKVNKLNPMEQ